jgi:histidinol-phosphate/aromatic aminotransferase/cobyric acid decarboxylase-like protein
VVSAQGEIAQLRQTVAGLREGLELAQIDKTNAINRERTLFADEGMQLQSTIQALRDQIEVMRTS